MSFFEEFVILMLSGCPGCPGCPAFPEFPGCPGFPAFPVLPAFPVFPGCPVFPEVWNPPSRGIQTTRVESACRVPSAIPRERSTHRLRSGGAPRCIRGNACH